MTEWEHEEEEQAVAKRRGCGERLAEAGPAAELEEAEAAEADRNTQLLASMTKIRVQESG